MNCSCIYVDCDDGRPEFFKERHPRARKTHICGECGQAIPLGEQYEYVSGKWEDRFAVYKTCSICLSIRSAFYCEGWAFGEVLGDLHEHIGEMDGNISSECLEDMSKSARDKVCDMIEEYWVNRYD